MGRKDSYIFIFPVTQNIVLAFSVVKIALKLHRFISVRWVEKYTTMIKIGLGHLVYSIVLEINFSFSF